MSVTTICCSDFKAYFQNKVDSATPSFYMEHLYQF